MSSKKISKEEVLHIAKLTALTLSEEEVKDMAEKLTDTLDYIDVLEELDTDNVEETYQVTGQTNVFQKDAESNTLTQKKTLSNAKEVVKDHFATEAVFDR